jgi:hypothetical protein
VLFPLLQIGSKEFWGQIHNSINFLRVDAWAALYTQAEIANLHRNVNTSIRECNQWPSANKIILQRMNDFKCVP